MTSLTPKQLIEKIEWELTQPEFELSDTPLLEKVKKLLKGELDSNHSKNDYGYTVVQIFLYSKQKLSWFKKDYLKNLLHYYPKYRVVSVRGIPQPLMNGYLISIKVLIEKEIEEK